jgi:hypothetical protein
MTRSFSAALGGVTFGCLSLGGCATFPVEAVDHVSLAAVEERVKCEIGEAYLRLKADRRFPDLSTWAAGVTLTLSVDSTGGIAPSTSLTGPFGSVSPLDLSFGASLNAKRTALMNVYVAFIEAADHPCPPPNSLLEGHMGLSEWIVRVFEAQYVVEQHSSLRSGFNADKSIGYTIEFLITASAGVTPNIIVANATGTKVGLSLEAKATHSADIAMVQMDEADFKKRFRYVRIPGKEIEIDNPALQNLPPGTLLPLGVPAKIKKRLPDKIVREAVGVTPSLGIGTKIRLDQVLQQLNNKILIQTLRR